MPVDVRKLMFSKQELILAFQTYAKSKNMGAPASKLEDVKIVEGALPAPGRVVSDKTPKGVSAVLHYASADANKPIRLNLSEEQIFEALIAFCRDLKVPLPKRGHKYVQIHKDALALTIGLNEKDIRSAREAATP